jgi:hypothetical protein
MLRGPPFLIVHQSFIARGGLAPQQVLAAIDALDLEFLAGLDVVALPELGWEDDLALAGNRRDDAG